MNVRIIQLIDFPLPFINIKDEMPIKVNLKIAKKEVRNEIEKYVQNRNIIRATEILRKLKMMVKKVESKNNNRRKKQKYLIITDKQLIYNKKSVFGLSEKNGNSIVSTYLLHKSEELNKEDLLKVMFHELGHGIGLGHCKNKGCVMTIIVTKRDLDKQRIEFCNDCKQRAQPKWKRQL